MSLPPYVTLREVEERLQAVFLDGTPGAPYVLRRSGTATVFAMLYGGAIEGTDVWIGPKHVYRMSDEQAQMSSAPDRREYVRQTSKNGSRPRGKQWFADNTREPIRDEALRQCLLMCGAAVERRGIPTTSSKPRYALTAGFAALFDPRLEDVEQAIRQWRRDNLSDGALARIAILRASKSERQHAVEVRLPSGGARMMAPGKSSIITKAVIEEFAPRFLEEARLVWLSESANQAPVCDDLLLKQIGIDLSSGRILPDIVLADVGQAGMLLVFVEVVSTDGPMTDKRKSEIRDLLATSGLQDSTAFVTAFMDRKDSPLPRLLDALAWDSLVWVASEPDCLIAMKGPSSQRLREIVRPGQ